MPPTESTYNYERNGGNMKKFAYVLLTLFTLAVIAIHLPHPVHAYDLPIDITAIGRQEIQTGRVTHRIGAHLFSEESRRVNYAMAQQVQQRQETAQTLFATVAWNYETDAHTRVQAGASNMALFSQPVTFTVFSTDTDTFQIPTWAIVLGLVVCAAVGFVLALRSTAKRRRLAEDVY